MQKLFFFQAFHQGKLIDFSTELSQFTATTKDKATDIFFPVFASHIYLNVLGLGGFFYNAETWWTHH